MTKAKTPLPRQRGLLRSLLVGPVRGCSDSALGEDIHRLAAIAAAELDLAIGGSEQCVVLALADVHAGVELGATLTNNDRPCGHFGAIEYLDAEALGP